MAQGQARPPGCDRARRTCALYAGISRCDAADWTRARAAARPVAGHVAPGYISHTALDLGDAALVLLSVFETRAPGGEHALQAKAQPSRQLSVPVAVATGEVVGQRRM
jgi:hypothetical protein